MTKLHPNQLRRKADKLRRTASNLQLDIAAISGAQGSVDIDMAWTNLGFAIDRLNQAAEWIEKAAIAQESIVKHRALAAATAVLGGQSDPRWVDVPGMTNPMPIAEAATYMETGE